MHLSHSTHPRLAGADDDAPDALAGWFGHIVHKVVHKTVSTVTKPLGIVSSLLPGQQAAPTGDDLAAQASLAVTAPTVVPGAVVPAKAAGAFGMPTALLVAGGASLLLLLATRRGA